MAGGPLGLFLQMPCGQEEGEGGGGGRRWPEVGLSVQRLPPDVAWG